MSEPCQLFCSVRKKWIASTPEEKVRQGLLVHMTQNLGYPSGSLALEIILSQIPHLRHIPSYQIPNRRADLIVLVPGLHPNYPLYPLLLIECKAIAITTKVIRQVVGYNQHLQACFIGVANENERRVGWQHPVQKDYHFLAELPPYEILLKQGRLMYTHITQTLS